MARYVDIFNDPRLLEFLEFGFPLGMENSASLERVQVDNHSSAVNYPEVIDKFLRKEIDLAAMKCPFDSVILYLVNIIIFCL